MNDVCALGIRNKIQELKQIAENNYKLRIRIVA